MVGLFSFIKFMVSYIKFDLLVPIIVEQFLYQLRNTSYKTNAVQVASGHKKLRFRGVLALILHFIDIDYQKSFRHTFDISNRFFLDSFRRFFYPFLKGLL